MTETQQNPRDPRFNALRHGLTARQLLIEGEEALAFESYRDDLFREWRPRGQAECAALHEMADAQWRLFRCSPIEAQLLQSLRDPDAPMGGLAAAFLGGSRAEDGALLRLARYRRTIERSYDRALHDLLLLHRARGVWSRPEIPATPDDAPEGPAASVHPRWRAPVAPAEAMLIEDDDSVVVTVERVDLDEFGRPVASKDHPAGADGPGSGHGEGPAAQLAEEHGRRHSEATVPPLRPKPDILQNEPSDFDDEWGGPGGFEPPGDLSRDRNRR